MSYYAYNMSKSLWWWFGGDLVWCEGGVVVKAILVFSLAQAEQQG